MSTTEVAVSSPVSRAPLAGALALLLLGAAAAEAGPARRGSLIDVSVEIDGAAAPLYGARTGRAATTSRPATAAPTRCALRTGATSGSASSSSSTA